MYRPVYTNYETIKLLTIYGWWQNVKQMVHKRVKINCTTANNLKGVGRNICFKG